MPSHFEASRGAYVVRDYDPGLPKGGTFYVQGTSAMANLVQILPRLATNHLNVKIVYTSSPELFALQSAEYRAQVISPADRMNSTVITTQARSLMKDWIFNHLAEEYALSSDWDDGWRTGGNLDEMLEEAHLSPEWIYRGIERFVLTREERLGVLRNEVA
jgi:transketolase